MNNYQFWVFYFLDFVDHFRFDDEEGSEDTEISSHAIG